MNAQKIISSLVFILASVFAHAQFPAGAHGGLIGFSGNYGNSFLNENDYDRNSNNVYVNVYPGITFYKEGNKSFSTGLNLSYYNQFQKSKSLTDTTSYKYSFMSAGLFTDCDKWITLSGSNQLFFITGCNFSAGAATRSNKNFNDTLINSYSSMQYQAGYNFHIGISYIRSSRWIWNLRYVPFAAGINYSRDRTDTSNRPNGTTAANVSFF